MTDGRAVDLLPRWRGPYEVAALQAMIDAWPLDVDAIARESDPMRCAADKLPFLAFDRGLVVWNDDWPEAKKRRYVRDAWIYKRLEGTPLGVEAYLNLADGAVIREVLPPSDAFAIPDDGGLTHAQVLALMPQLRLYYHWPDASFAATVGFADRACADRWFAYPDQGEMLGRYPVLYDPAAGVETPLQASTYDEVGRAVVLSHRGYTGSGFYADASCADRSFAGEPAVEAPIVLDLADPGMETVKASPPLRPWELAAGASQADRTFAAPDIGDVGTYDRLTLYDGARLPGGTSLARAAFYADWSWLGLPPYTEILTVTVPGTPARVPYPAFTADAGFALSDRQDGLFGAVQAVALAKRAGDRMLLDLAPTFAGTRVAPLPTMDAI